MDILGFVGKYAMLNKIKFSVIIPCHNGYKHIATSLGSILSQCSDNVEVIVIDDCSTDDSQSRIKEVAKAYPDAIVRVLINETNKGVSYSRNCGIRNASGEYILFLDADDTYSDGIFDTLLDVLYSNNKPDLISFSILRQGGEGKTSMSYVRQEWDRNVFTGHQFGKLFLSKKINQSVCSVAINREFLIANEIFFSESVSLGEDIAFQIKCMVSASNVIYISQDFYHYNYNPGSVTNKGYGLKHLTCCHNYDEVSSFLIKNGHAKLIPELVFYYQYMFFYELRFFLKSNDDELINKYLISDNILNFRAKLIISKYGVILGVLKIIYKMSPNVLISLLKG